MKFEVYGKKNCAKCESTKQKLAHLATKFAPEADTEVVFVDVDTVMGRAEGAFHDVNAIPTTLVRTAAGDVGLRWDGVIPPADAVKELLAGGARAEA